MFEVANAREDHRHIMLIAEVYRVLVFNRATRLDHGTDTLLVRDLYTIGEGKESVGGHHRTRKIEAKRLRFFNSLLQCIYPGGLAYTAGQ